MRTEHGRLAGWMRVTLALALCAVGCVACAPGHVESSSAASPITSVAVSNVSTPAPAGVSPVAASTPVEPVHSSSPGPAPATTASVPVTANAAVTDAEGTVFADTNQLWVDGQNVPDSSQSIHDDYPMVQTDYSNVTSDYQTLIQTEQTANGLGVSGAGTECPMVTRVFNDATDYYLQVHGLATPVLGLDSQFRTADSDAQKLNAAIANLRHLDPTVSTTAATAQLNAYNNARGQAQTDADRIIRTTNSDTADVAKLANEAGAGQGCGPAPSRAGSIPTIVP